MPNLSQKDYAKPLFLTFGADSFDSMGIPTVIILDQIFPYWLSQGTWAHMMSWKKCLEIISPMILVRFLNEKVSFYFKDRSEKKNAPPLEFAKYPEAKIDSTKLEKEYIIWNSFEISPENDSHEMERAHKANISESPVSNDLRYF